MPTLSISLDEASCPQCGYSLRGLASQKCPECGYEVARLLSAESRIPWVHRSKIGRFRAFWKTVWFVTFRGREFRFELVRPVSYADAQRFRWVVVWLAFAAVVAALLTFVEAGPAEWRELVANFGLEIWLLGLGGLFLFFVAATGVPSYFFHPRYVSVEQQNRALALSYYACAPLAWLPACYALLLLIVGLAMANEFKDLPFDRLLLVLSAKGALGLVFSAYMSVLFRLAGAATHRITRQLGVFFGVSMLWSAGFLVFVVWLPLSTLYTVLLLRNIVFIRS